VTSDSRQPTLLARPMIMYIIILLLLLHFVLYSITALLLVACMLADKPTGLGRYMIVKQPEVKPATSIASL